ncbi:MAG: hypothetical protein JXR37_04010 [Kiritimatiellae bacterium]|nr:hypothetical protein [Kiritimatiellia bacterium]
MRRRYLFTMLLATIWTVICCGSALAEIRKFRFGGGNLGVWRLTRDPAVRDEGNYHNTQCWSANGRYTCYTHWGGAQGPGGKDSAEVHVVDLLTGEDRCVDKGINPRWANKANHLFYCRFTRNGAPRYETGSQVVRYDAETGEKVVITHGMEVPGGTDSEDRWVIGWQNFRDKTRKNRAVRALNRANSPLEVMEGAPNKHWRLLMNPRHPVIQVRTLRPDGGGEPGPYHVQRTLIDLDGSNHRAGFIQAEKGHSCWRGDGEYLLTGDGILRGRKWDRPYPSDLEVFTCGKTGNDVSPCGASGRYVCSDAGKIVDLRSGDGWYAVHFGSHIIWPMDGDFSHIVDSDQKGSPDGTKVHFHTTCDLEHLVQTPITAYDEKAAPDVLRVASTDGFPETGDLVAGSEVIGYRRKTATTFEGLTRRKYDSRPAKALGRKTRSVSPLSRCVLSGADKARARPLAEMVRAGFPPDHPLIYQRQTDCYIVIVRLPFRPHLRLCGRLVDLIPGESHWETRGYRLLRDGRPVADALLAPGTGFALPGPGTYTAVAVEWSGLESAPSLPLTATRTLEGRVLAEPPADFSWTREVWQVEGQPVSAEQAARAPAARMELVHLHDGVIAREDWQNGRRRTHADLNADGQPTRLIEYDERGTMRKRTHQTPKGVVGSVELYGADGFKTEWIEYDVVGEPGKTKEHTWYDHGRPVKRVSWRGNFDFTQTARK